VAIREERHRKREFENRKRGNQIEETCSEVAYTDGEP
jgi:hypothetical protein